MRTQEELYSIRARVGYIQEKFDIGIANHVDIRRIASFDFYPEFEGNIDYLHIDGNHSYENVKKDFEQFIPRVNEGGIIGQSSKNNK